jgi:hypothetical protein
MRDRCRTAGTAYFLKQLGDAAHEGGRPYRCRARKGGDPDEWPDDLRVREWPPRLTESIEQREAAEWATSAAFSIFSAPAFPRYELASSGS